MYGYANLGEHTVLFSLEDNALELYLDTSKKIEHVDLWEEKMVLPKEGNYIIGSNIVGSHKYVFLVDRVPNIPTIFTISTVRVYSYIEYRYTVDSIYGLGLYCDELNHFYSVKKGYELSIPEDLKSSNLQTIPYDNTTESFAFDIDGLSITCTFGVEAKAKTQSQNPLVFTSRMLMEFENLKTIDTLYSIYYTAWSFMCFIAYRKNILFETTLYGKNENGKLYPIGEYHLFVDLENPEDEKAIRDIVSYDILKGNISKLFSEIVNNKLYMQHIPESKRNGRKINPARFVLITAAFEWTIREVYDIPVSDTQNTVKEDILNKLSTLSSDKQYNRRKRDSLGHFLDIIGNIDNNLSKKIAYVLNDLDSILNPFIVNLYKMNGKEVDPYTRMADRIQKQRNNYAHGNIDKEMDSDVVLDIIILEWVNHAMVFKKMGYTEHEIAKLINSIFDRNFYINDEE